MTDLVVLDPDEVLTTTRSVRRRLDLERPVPRELVLECLDLALQAPNGSNQQRWDWVVVDDPDLRRRVAEVYRAAMGTHSADPDRTTRGIDYSSGTQARISASVRHLAEHLHEVPVLVIPTVRWRLDGADIFTQASVWGSILPAVWSLMLAARARGLGSAWTTIHLHREAEMAELLGIPHDTVTQAGLFPLAYTVGTDFRPAERAPATESTHWNGW
jgi:nitroreductase